MGNQEGWVTQLLPEKKEFNLLINMAEETFYGENLKPGLKCSAEKTMSLGGGRNGGG